ncbi:RlmE family RNA methyltransferase [Coxiella burnetii]|uniref:Ribosomal RNA large subunit methyltransferase E n=1 Tax=Coxiella burnetii (strain RSA 331 / Henzerling II) TaxID=360115 RepID=RLME_COXBR|nr:RlmE family RNA methyltransferase [Coxiella burnetii]A9N8M5.1 RecName: Full=Ribosomal RNA large subunit methyltransferase E; AltName: Full=23S rRNA Um2552 methyltransferase; AltName: Full=rRNA (uridine-2'-O-)-methyltransferase [Coxiella burnetii RSA 331]ABX78050.1 ribosomal RNA large subunit methyltransferase J [Coxiella burnetii RSA 331]ATN82407.1 23S rRNA methyltransferase [Coxiella burnetii]ATN84309.1 23S rRNA methyltransferase [Coxiella burnetii]POZ77798.1 ribosomal RNA large subunit me
MTHSKRWLEEHAKDPYVKRAKKEGYPSRAAYKLLEIHQKYKLFKPSMNVIDLGAAPGGWSQVAKDLVGPKGVVIAIDLLPMQSMLDVIFIQGDFNEPEIFNQLEAIVAKKTLTGQVDLVISDMAPNISGIKNVDQSRSLHLVELAWDCAQKLLARGGTFLVKVFQGPGVDRFLINLRPYFNQVKFLKPSASRSRSSEIYILAGEFLGYNQRV